MLGKRTEKEKGKKERNKTFAETVRRKKAKREITSGKKERNIETNKLT